MEPKSNYQRSPSTQLTIQDILGGEYIQDESNTTNHLLTTDKKKVVYANLIGNILRKEVVGTITNFWVDDGTGQIILRFFEDHKKARELKVGDIVLVIGKPRVYNDEKYISPEIVSKVDPLWLKIRSLKLPIKETKKTIVPISQTLPDTSEKLEQEEEIVDEEKDKKELLPMEKIARLIKELDRGQGALIESVLEQSPLTDTEQILKRMLENGEIFQNSPGKVKVL